MVNASCIQNSIIVATGQLVETAERTTGMSRRDLATDTSVLSVKRLPVHIRMEEKLSAVMSRDGGLENCEVDDFRDNDCNT